MNEPAQRAPVLDSSSGTRIEHMLERLLFLSRWLMAPFYLGLAIALLILLIEFGRQMAILVHSVQGEGHDSIIIGILALIELSLMGNLLLMVMFAGYEGFVSKLRIANDAERLDWMGQIGFGDLKLKLTTSIVAISAIRLLETFMNIGSLPDRDLAWTVGIYGAFVVSALVLATMERLLHK
jgi:uncharacterized protein (TIGR00645 family)